MCIFSEKLKTALRDLYSGLTVPVQESLDVDSCTAAALADMYVDLRTQMSGTTKFPETTDYRDVAKLQKLMQASQPIQLSELFEKLDNRLAPRTVLLLGRAGVGKSTLVKHISRLWANEELWKDVEFLFLITLRQLKENRQWTLEDLLLGDLPLTEDEKRVAMELLQEKKAKVLVVQDGLDEIDSTKNTELNSVLSSIIHNEMLEGAKVLLTSRPKDNLPKCERNTELYGFPEDSIEKYIEKFSNGDTDLETYIKSHLQNNVNIATLCYLPVQCNFVCVCLSAMHSAAQSEKTSAVNTMTQLYVISAVNMARKHHPSLKYSRTPIDSDTFYVKMDKSLKSHAALAKHCTMSSPLQIIFYEEDLEKFDIEDEDRRTGFLAETKTTGRTVCFTQPCWSFNHLTIQEMFAAVGLLLGPEEELMKLVEDETSIRQREVLLTFVLGLWCDPQNAEFMEHLGLTENKVDPRTFMKKLAVVFDVMQLTTAVHETQRPSLVDLVPENITSENVFPTEMAALSWVLRQEECRITSLE